MGESRVPEIYAVYITFALLSTIVTILRLHLRLTILRNFGIDDVLIIIAVLLNWVYFALAIYATKRGYGRHVWEVPPEDMEFLLRNLYMSNIIGAISPTFVKLSILYLFRRITSEPSHVLIIRSMQSFLIIYTVVMTFVNIFMCTPISAAWDLRTYPAHCMKIPDLKIVQSVASIVTDVLLFAMPLPVLAATQLPKRDKAIVMGILAIAILTIAASGAKIAFYARYLRMAYSSSWYGAEERTARIDMTWRVADGGEWTTIENDLMVICSSAFALRRLWVTRHGPRVQQISASGVKFRGEEDAFRDYESMPMTEPTSS